MVKVLGSRLLVREEKAGNQTKSGLVLPGREKEPTFKGTVIAVGDGALLENGTRVPMSVNIGDKIVYTSFSGSPLDVDGEIFIVLNERDVLAIL